jgi:hypothetical protein
VSVPVNKGTGRFLLPGISSISLSTPPRVGLSRNSLELIEKRNQKDGKGKVKLSLCLTN